VATTANVPAFNMQQKVMAAPALQDLQSNDPSKFFLQSQLQHALPLLCSLSQSLTV
jgi:hypothetical protein